MFEGCVPRIDGESFGWARVVKKNANASKPSEHTPSQGGKVLKGLGRNIGCRDENTSWG